MKLGDFEQRADDLIAQADQVLQTTSHVEGYAFVAEGPFRGFRAAALSFLATTYGEEHVYFGNSIPSSIRVDQKM